MKKLLRSALALISLFFANTLLACSCTPIPLIQLLELGEVEHLVKLRVQNYEQVSGGFPGYMEGTILDQIRGEIDAEQIQVVGGDGLSCAPYVTAFDIGDEWLVPLIESNSAYFLPACTSPVRFEGDEIIGLVSPLSCTANPASERNCSLISPEEYEQALSARMSLDEFNTQLSLYEEAVAWTLQACTGPWSRCSQVRASYDPESGELVLPAVDVISSPLNFGVSAKLQLLEGSSDTFRVKEVE